jgi:hypothetical protein
MEQQTPQAPQSTLHKTFGIISLVLGILAFLFSFIPCLGMYAIFPGILGLIMGVVAFIMAGKVNAPKGMIIAGVVLSVLGTGVAAWQYSKLKDLSKDLNDPTKMKELKNSLDSLSESLKSLDTANHQ